ncbi:MAG: hypothetical protein H6555_02960 [Lewinellaceae bacterium]|nr:hypothetical protein [Lewinellaceae bacterium]
MNAPAKSLFVFGLYLILIVGLGLILMPVFLLDLFQLPYGDDIWIRFVGMLALVLGIYYLAIARNDVQVMFPITVWMRLFAALFMIAFWVMGKLGWGILVFAATDFAGAIWTWLAMRQKSAS